MSIEHHDFYQLPAISPLTQASCVASRSCSRSCDPTAKLFCVRTCHSEA